MFTPLGSFPAFGPIVATLGMIPVVVTSILLGAKAGSAMGFFTGLFSFTVWTFMPLAPSVAFIFTPFCTLGKYSGNFGSLVICFVPRILVGTVAGFFYDELTRVFPDKKRLYIFISAMLGSFTNTVGVLGGAGLFFINQYAALDEGSVGINILISGIVEAIICAVIAVILFGFLKNRTGKA